jgi:hypothetical protein
MSYGEFTLKKVRDDFGLTLVEGDRFLPTISPVVPGSYLVEFLQESIPLAIGTGSEKARSELIISPLLLEVRRQTQRQVSIFSGEDFTVDASVGLNGVCDFLISRSTEQMLIEAPVVIILEAKKGDLKPGLGQCIAEMVAAQRFNQINSCLVSTLYGAISNGTVWRFLKLEGTIVTLDLTEYSLNPIGQLLGTLLWMATIG